MAAIASKRVRKEFLEMPKPDEPNRPFYLEPVDSNLLHLKGFLVGPTETPFEGGVFNIEMRIPDTYPFNPPKVKFTTRIWHPNISSVTGAICLDILKDQWAAAMTLRTVVLSIQALLSSAEPDDPQDAVVARQFKDHPDVYRGTAKYWTYFFAMSEPEKTNVEQSNQFLSFEEKIAKLVGIINTTRSDALVALSHYNWNLEGATQSLL